MKKNLLFCIGFAISSLTMAQTNVTSKYINNPSFEKNGTEGWTVSGLVTQTNTSFSKKAGTTYLEKWVDKNSTAGSVSLSQTLATLEPGKYTLTAGAQNISQNDATKACTGAAVYAGSKSTTVTAADDYSVDFTYLEGDLSIGFRVSNTNGNWISVDNFRLYYNGAPDIADVKKLLQTLVTEGKTLYGDGSGALAAELKTAIDAAEAVIAATDATSEAALEAWSTLKQSIADYRLANVSETAPLDYTHYIVNPSFEDGGSKGWTCDALVSQSNSSFTKKKGSIYLEKWVDKGKQVGSASVSQKIANLPNGQYRLTVAAQNLNQNSTSQKCSGAVIYAGSTEENVYTAKDYELKFTSIAGEVEVGFRAKNATGNWLSVDNFRLELIGHVSMADIVAEIGRSVAAAEAMQDKMMSSKTATALAKAIEQGKAISEASTDADIKAAKKALDAAIAGAQTSIDEYAQLAAAIASAQKAYDETKQGAEEYKEAIAKAEAMVANADATSAQLAQEIENLSTALLAFNLANATHGTTVKVTVTNQKILTGSTEALMRATMTGTALEKGICWSTEHNPTVLDNRTTESHNNNGLIFHARNLKPATVYYMRPYIMSKTYEVAYGDEVKLVTHPKGTCTGSWDEGAPDEAANKRCRDAIAQTIEYFNQWTGIKGFNLSGHYGAATPTADCSYGGWMRIGPNAGNQAIGTVIHETGHGVGVGTSSRWSDKNVHDWIWKGREANEIFHFLENKYENVDGNMMVGDGTHGWGQNASYDWFVNGADKDKHSELQYLGGCCLLYGLFIDGLNPTTAYKNGLAGYTYNFDDDQRYYLMCKDANRGLGEGFLYQRTSTAVAWTAMNEGEVSDSAAWQMEYVPSTGYYRFKNVATGKYLSHGTGVQLKASATTTENFQLMPDRTDVTVKGKESSLKTHGYWLTWENSGSKSVVAGDKGTKTYGTLTAGNFDYADTATTQQWIILSESEIQQLGFNLPTGIEQVQQDDVLPSASRRVTGIYNASGVQRSKMQQGINIIRYADGSSKKVVLK
ncbi:MAG: hypothetical protein KBT39_08855 [Bacteroidales bacterium]|nr:hypothetical protein [Bacteroidales bacterium]